MAASLPLEQRSSFRASRPTSAQTSVFPAGKLPPGRHLVTVVVRDPTNAVLKDERHLLEERAAWVVSIRE